MKCLVTGATGFIGRYLCQQLLARGDTVIALSKSGAPLADGTVTRGIDLGIAMPPTQLLQGVDVVFHLAGIAHQQAATSAYRDLNELATLRLARLASEAGVACFVFISSVKAMGPAIDASARAEQDCSLPADAYGLSKWRAECALREEFGNGPMAVVILRPALVYGPAAKGNLALLARAVGMGLPRPPLAGARSMVALDDLVALMCLVADSPGVGVHTWIAADGWRYTTRSIYDQLRSAAGKGTGTAWLPIAGWRLVAALLDLLSSRRGESTFDRLFGTELYSNRAVLEQTAWRPQCRLESVAVGMMEARSSAQ